MKLMETSDIIDSVEAVVFAWDLHESACRLPNGLVSIESSYTLFFVRRCSRISSARPDTYAARRLSHAMSVFSDGGPCKRASSRNLTPNCPSTLYRDPSKPQNSRLSSHTSDHERTVAFLTAKPSELVNVVIDQSSRDGVVEKMR